MEIPCVLVFQGSDSLVSKVKKMLQLCEQKPNKANKAITAQDTTKEALKDGEDVPGNPAKKVKVEEEESTSRCEDVRLYHKIRLSLEDRNTVSNGRQLNDKHINFVQIILKEKFPNITGLQLTLLQTKFKLDIHMPLVQILHVHGDHWIAISNLQCETGKILIYDSVFNTVDSQVRQLVENIFDLKINLSIHDNMPKQAGITDCAVFAIATATSLLYGIKPNKYTQSLLRSHLIKCFENFNITPFP